MPFQFYCGRVQAESQSLGTGFSKGVCNSNVTGCFIGEQSSWESHEQQALVRAFVVGPLPENNDVSVLLNARHKSFAELGYKTKKFFPDWTKYIAKFLPCKSVLCQYQSLACRFRGRHTPVTGSNSSSGLPLSPQAPSSPLPEQNSYLMWYNYLYILYHIFIYINI